MILDIHTHHLPPQPQGVISVDADKCMPYAGQLYSVGVHPWREDAEALVGYLRELASDPAVVAIGECGLDTGKGAPMYSQILTFRACIGIAVEAKKPMIIHDVKSHAQIIAMHREYAPEALWAIHGFRGKPTVARMLTDEGFYLSFGRLFNPDTLRTVPPEKILAETDDADASIEEVIALLSSARPDISDFEQLIANNTAAFLKNSHTL